MTERPGSAGRRASSRRPEGSSRRPEGSSRRPEGSSRRPEGSSRRPEGSSRRPDSGGSRSLTVLVAPDSFKGSLTSVEVARALASGWELARPGDRLLLAPLADGGEGTLAAMEAAGGWSWRTAPVADPLGRIVEARWLLAADGAGRRRSSGSRRAVVELAEASGLSRLSPTERDPLRASTVGSGELLRAALDAGVRRIVLGIGGSATTDGGAGLLVALGVRLRGSGGRLLAADGQPGDGGWPAVMAALERVDLSGLDPRLAELELSVASDVANPLLGPAGAAATYGPQKGATAADVTALDAGLARWADHLEAATGRRERDTPGAGAAGGVGFALLCLRDRFGALEFRPGVELVMAETGFEARLREADLVVTGEGRIDAQTAFGKTAMGVARRAAVAGRPVVAVGGGVTVEGARELGRAGVVVVPVVEAPQSVEEAMAAGLAPLERCGERLARLVSLGLSFCGEAPIDSGRRRPSPAAATRAAANPKAGEPQRGRTRKGPAPRTAPGGLH